MTDISDRYARIADGFTARIEAVPADAWDNDSPCEGWKARDVALHVINGCSMFLGEEPPSGLADDQLAGAWKEGRSKIEAALLDPERAAGTAQTPMGPMPLEAFIGRIATADVLIHTWDLARATGLDETLDAEGVAGTYSGMKPMDAMIRQPGIFGPKVECAEDADEQTQLLTFLGRQV